MAVVSSDFSFDDFDSCNSFVIVSCGARAHNCTFLLPIRIGCGQSGTNTREHAAHTDLHFEHRQFIQRDAVNSTFCCLVKSSVLRSMVCAMRLRERSRIGTIFMICATSNRAGDSRIVLFWHRSFLLLWILLLFSFPPANIHHSLLFSPARSFPHTHTHTHRQ